MLGLKHWAFTDDKLFLSGGGHLEKLWSRQGKVADNPWDLGLFRGETVAASHTDCSDDRKI
jgi:hypothetical protein